MRNLFRKKQNKFIKMMHDQTALTLAGIEALKAYMDNQGKETAAFG